MENFVGRVAGKILGGRKVALLGAVGDDAEGAQYRHDDGVGEDDDGAGGENDDGGVGEDDDNGVHCRTLLTSEALIDLLEVSPGCQTGRCVSLITYFLHTFVDTFCTKLSFLTPKIRKEIFIFRKYAWSSPTEGEVWPLTWGRPANSHLPTWPPTRSWTRMAN